MKETLILTEKNISDMLEKLLADNVRLYAPVDKGSKTIFSEVKSSAEIARDYIQTTLSAKEVLFPRYEMILRYENRDRETVIYDETPSRVKTVIFGTRPCDGRSLMIMDAVFGGDYVDSFYQDKRNNTAVISISCDSCDEYCFCTTVDSGPGDTSGSDILLTEITTDRYLAEILTEKGNEIVNAIRKDCEEATIEYTAQKQKHLADVKTAFDKDELLQKMKPSFGDDIYVKQSLRCTGCGICSYVCPACTCFDIQDETSGKRGIRLKCWDSCGFAEFTVHTSGHNPREEQSQRWRQRIMHKYDYQPDTLNMIGCTGCGRCSRSCPAGMMLSEHLNTIAGKDFTEKK